MQHGEIPIKQVFADAAADIVSGLGEAATYTAPDGGDPVACIVVIHREVQSFPSGFESQLMEPHDEISLLLAEIGTPQRGGIIVIGAETWEIAGPPIANDGYIARVIVAPPIPVIVVVTYSPFVTDDGDYLVTEDDDRLIGAY